jgi:hypothetical protein
MLGNSMRILPHSEQAGTHIAITRRWVAIVDAFESDLDAVHFF